MNPEIEAEKNSIILSFQAPVLNSLVSDLAAARVEIRQLKAQIEAAKPKS